LSAIELIIALAHARNRRFRHTEDFGKDGVFNSKTFRGTERRLGDDAYSSGTDSGRGSLGTVIFPRPLTGKGIASVPFCGKSLLFLQCF
jgi:hypothetical protein